MWQRKTMSIEKPSGFYEWISISTNTSPESAIPPSYAKPLPPRKRRKRRYEKSTQTDFKDFHGAQALPTDSRDAVVQTNPPPPPNDDDRVFILVSLIILGIILKKYVNAV